MHILDFRSPNEFEATTSQRIGAELTAKRIALGLDQATLAAHAGIDVVDLQVIEAGEFNRFPSIPSLAARMSRICNVLEVNPASWQGQTPTVLAPRPRSAPQVGSGRIDVDKDQLIYSSLLLISLLLPFITLWYLLS